MSNEPYQGLHAVSATVEAHEYLTRSLRSSVVKHALMEEATHTLFVLRGGNSTYLPRYSLCVSWVLVLGQSTSSPHNNE